MRKFNIKAQIHKLYTLTTVGYFRIAGASWVALLALRGFSMFEIGMLESIFHIVSSSFEIPSGVVADVFGRKKTMINGQSYQCQEKDASVIYDAMDGAWKTEEMSDQKIQSMGKW